MCTSIQYSYYLKVTEHVKLPWLFLEFVGFLGLPLLAVCNLFPNIFARSCILELYNSIIVYIIRTSLVHNYNVAVAFTCALLVLVVARPLPPHIEC